MLVSLVAWYREMPDTLLHLAANFPHREAGLAYGATVFLWLNTVLLRSIHHWCGVPFTVHALFASLVVQATVFISWSLAALVIMTLATRRGARPLWLGGASLLGVVVAKLFLVDLSGHGSVARIVSFLVVGLLILVIGWFSAGAAPGDRRRCPMKRLIMFLMLSLAMDATPPADAAPGLNDFARSMPVVVAGNGALYELPLPAEVYRWSTSRTLADVAVFNSAGEVVPFALVPPVLKQGEADRQALPVFVFNGTNRSSSGNVALQVRTDEHGAIVSLNTSPIASSLRSPVIYLVDASRLKRSISGFDVALAPTAVNYLGTLQVETSDDLQQWRLHSVGAVAGMASGEATLTQQRVLFPAVSCRYFRLMAGPEQNVPRIDAITARMDTPASGPSRSTAEMDLNPVPGRTGEFTVKTEGSLPVDRVRLRFAADNSVADVTILSRPDDTREWCVRGSAIFYRLRRGPTVLESAPLEVQPTGDTCWLIRIRQQGRAWGRFLPGWKWAGFPLG